MPSLRGAHEANGQRSLMREIEFSIEALEMRTEWERRNVPGSDAASAFVHSVAGATVARKLYHVLHIHFNFCA